jgi:hypothetical protein
VGREGGGQISIPVTLAHESIAAPDADGPAVIVVPTQPHQAYLG